MQKVYVLPIIELNSKGNYDKAFSLLDASRREKVLRMKHSVDQCRSMAAGLLLHYALCEEGYDFSRLALEFGPNGKPYLANSDHLFYNISHSGNVVMLALGDREQGIDVELVERIARSHNMASIAKRCFSEKELEGFLSEKEKGKEFEIQEFAKLWTRKEALTKAYGSGLATQLKELDTLSREYMITEEFCLEGKQYAFSLCQKEDEPISGLELKHMSLDEILNQLEN